MIVSSLAENTNFLAFKMQTSFISYQTNKKKLEKKNTAFSPIFAMGGLDNIHLFLNLYNNNYYSQVQYYIIVFFILNHFFCLILAFIISCNHVSVFFRLYLILAKNVDWVVVSQVESPVIRRLK